MEIERCSNTACRRPFEISEYGLQMPGTKEPEDITCPHCAHTITRISNGFFRTHALTGELEAQFNTNNPI